MSLNPGDDESRIDRLHRLLDELHERTPRRELALQMLKKSLKANPPFEEPKTLLPVHEAEIRRDFAIKLEAEIRTNPFWADFRLNAVQVATILYVPISTLMPGGYLSLRDSGGQLNSAEDLFRRLDGVRLLVKHFLRPNQDKELLDNDALSELFRTPRSLRTPRSKRTQSPASLPSSKKSKRSSKTRQKRHDPDAEYLPKEEEGRDKDERDKCFERDGKACVLMRTVDPHVCHIIPFSWNNKELNIRNTALVFEHAAAFLGRDWKKKYQTYLQNPRCPGGSDKAWNMICLNLQLHHWWGKARLGFKYLGIRSLTDTSDMSVVTIQFHWMPCSATGPKDTITLQGQDNGFDRMVKSAKDFHKGGNAPSPQEFGTIAALSAASAAPILSGDLVDVKMLSSETHLFKAMIEFQWAMIVVAAFSGGAAEEPELLLGDDDDSDKPDFRTTKWVEDQQSRQAISNMVLRGEF
ncbi:hypothetical protein CDV31_014180 [Fusarium ambrosium]|uniref:HNH nuclease domain-containing protein n=1 Tax=Fusarium ambrosium TaxID=131363 RepID=A0A428SY44_9HYPO|nr:hypothetical protein CDV31_014180 [Fusarium ambrosium]